MTFTYIAPGFALGLSVGLTAIPDGPGPASLVPKKFLRGLLAMTLTGVAAKRV